MKQINLIQGELSLHTTKGEEQAKIETIQLINTAIDNMPPGGFNVTEMMERLAVQGKVKEIEKQMKTHGDNVYDIPEGGKPWRLELEDAEFKNLGTWVNSVKWAHLSQFTVDFILQFKEK